MRTTYRPHNSAGGTFFATSKFSSFDFAAVIRLLGN